MQVFFINAMVSFAKWIDVTDGTTVGELLQQEVGGDPKGYTIRVNQQKPAEGDLLQDGDRITVSPTEVIGQRVPHKTPIKPREGGRMKK